MAEKTAGALIVALAEADQALRRQAEHLREDLARVEAELRAMRRTGPFDSERYARLRHLRHELREALDRLRLSGIIGKE